MKRLSFIALLVGLLTSGCAVGTEEGPDVDAETESIGFEDDVRFARDHGSVDVALDAAIGEDLSLADETAYQGDDGGPDPTPWKLTSDEQQVGPDPTPWRDGDDDEDDDYGAAAGTTQMGPDPTPWSPSIHPTDEDDDGEPDPQPWETARVGDGNNDE